MKELSLARKKFVSFLIGVGSLSHYCAQILKETSTLIAILTSDIFLMEWAENNNIYFTSSLENFSKYLDGKSIDYGFNLGKITILLPNLLNFPHQIIINYQPSLLPQLSGSYSTTWALLHGNTHHAVTWFISIQKAKQRDILKQVIFPITPADTSFTLDLKCYEQAVNSFPILIEELQRETFKRFPITDLTVENFYYCAQRPDGFGIINWQNAAHLIVNQAHALNFNEADNTFLSLKIMIGSNLFLASELNLKLSLIEKKPGTIVNFDEFIEIATSTDSIIIKKITDLLGNVIKLNYLARQYGLKKDYCLSSCSPKRSDYLTTLYKKSLNDENFWVNFFRKINVDDICPFIKIKNKKTLIENNIPFYHLFKENLNIKPLISYYLSNYTNEVILTSLFLVYFSRLHNYEETPVYLSTIGRQSRVLEAEDVFSAWIPISISFQPDFLFVDCLKKTASLLGEMEDKTSYCKDIFSRYSDIKHKKCLNFSLTFENNTLGKDTAKPHLLSAIDIKINEVTHVISFYFHERTIFKSHLKVMKLMTGHLNRLAESIKQNPGTSISHLTLLTDTELKTLDIRSFNLTEKSNPEKFLHHIIEKNAQRFPKKVALFYNHRSYTYEEINNLANNIAKNLKLIDDEQNIVSVLLSPSPELICSFLAILKAGAAYLPLDPYDPPVELEYIITHSRSRIIISSSTFARKLELLKKLNCMSLLLDEQTFITENKCFLSKSILKPIDLAYVIYTSGSLGKRKGIGIMHSNFSYSLLARTNYYSTPPKRMLLLLPPTFDAASASVWWPLITRGELFLLNDISNPLHIAGYISRYQITHIITLPNIYQAVLSICGTHELSSLQVVILGGESWHRELIHEHCRLAPNAYLYNEYGLTECSIWSSVKKIVTPYHCKSPFINIGKPLANTDFQVVDKFQQPLPRGVVGELVIGGKGVSPGYLHDFKLTQERFISDLFAYNNKGVWRFKTNDKVIQLENGEFHYLGREDDLLKIAGHRFSILSIEEKIKNISIIKDCVVLPLSHHKSDIFLIAFIILKLKDDLYRECHFKEFLKEKLPFYLLPKKFFFVENFPLTLNKKIDRQALLKLSFDLTVPIKPHTNIEKKIYAIYRKILKISDFSIEKNFFELGGNSLNGALVVTELITIFKLQDKKDFLLKEFFLNPSLKSLALILEKNFSPLLTLKNSEAFQLNDAFSGTEILNTCKNVLITGSTGFLGSHLLQRLMKEKIEKIYCLVHADNLDEAFQRIEITLKKNRLEKFVDFKKLVLLPGDLSKEKLGLSSARFTQLAKNIDHIYHNGALINHIYPYRDFEATNVNGTQVLIDLARLYKHKKIHYISPIGASVEKEDNSIHESFNPSKISFCNDEDGYLKTKALAEKILSSAQIHGLGVNIYRLGWISGNTHSGLCDPWNNHLFCLIKSCIELELAPEMPVTIDAVPVNMIADWIVNLSFHFPQISKIYNLSNVYKFNWTQWIQTFNKHGFFIKLISPALWYRYWNNQLTHQDPLYPFSTLYPSAQQLGWLSRQKNLPLIHIKKTEKALKNLNLSYPEFADMHLDKIIAYLREIGFLSPDVSREKIHLLKGSNTA